MSVSASTQAPIELDLNGRHSKANLVWLLEVLTVQLKTVYFRNATEVANTLAQYGEQWTQDDKAGYRLKIAEMMMKEHFEEKTREVLADRCQVFMPASYGKN